MKLDSSHLNTAATVAAAIAAFASCVAAFKSNKTSKTLAKIERDRRHAELYPVFDVALEKLGTDNLKLTLWLRGPDSLGKIESLIVSIRDDKQVSASPVGSPTESEIAKQIWGPRRFTPAVGNASEDGRSVPYSNLIRGDKAIFQLEKTPMPTWMTSSGTDEWWEQMGIERLIKISIYCKNSEMDGWTVPWDVTLPSRPRAF